MYICCISITTGICSKVYLMFLFSCSMTGAWRWSGHPISWKQTLSLHLWVDINLIYLYCICILIFCSLRKKITRISPRKVQQQPAVCKTSAADFVTCDYRLKHIICFNQIISTYQNKTSALMPALSTVSTFCGSLDCQYLCPQFFGLSELLSTISKIVFSRFCFFSLHLNLSLLSSGFHPENRLVVYVSVNFSNFDKNVNFENLLATLTVFPHMSYCGLLPPTW